MSDSSKKPWSSKPNAPQIIPHTYIGEKDNFAGVILSAIFCGIAIVLFFQCMATFFDPIHRARGGIKWGFVVHTVAMFSCLMIFTGMSLDIQAISYVDYRGFPEGPLFYQIAISSGTLTRVPYIVLMVNQWLADGLLLYRCYVICAKNYWIIAIPSMLYLASIGMGVYYAGGAVWIHGPIKPSVIHLRLSYHLICFSVNTLCSLIITVRLIMHSRNIRKALGAQSKASGLYTVIVTTLIESSALYAVTYIPYIVSWVTRSGAQLVSLPVLAVAQVIGPFLIIVRVANHRALTSDAITTGNIVGSIRFGNQDSSGGSAATTGPNGHHMIPLNRVGKTSSGLGSTGVKTTNDSFDATRSEGSLNT